MKSEKGKDVENLESENTPGGKKFKKEMIKVVREANHGKEDVSSMVRKRVASALNQKGVDSCEVRQVIKDLIEGALEAVEEIGIGLATTSRKIARGIILGTHDAGGNTIYAAGYSIKCAIKEASSYKADIGQVAIATSDGVIEAVQEIGGNVEITARALIAGAIESASVLGKKNGKKIHVAEFLQASMCKNHQKVCE
jgi:hypothetical protein